MKQRECRKCTLQICGTSFLALLVFIGLAFGAPSSGGGGGGKAAGIVISAPATAVAGQEITVTVTPVNGANLSWVMVGADPGGGIGEGIKEAAPFTFTYLVPVDIIGTVKIGAMGVDLAFEKTYEANSVLNVSTPATLTSMELRKMTSFDRFLSQNTTIGTKVTWAQSMRFYYYMETERASIVGTYSDGVERGLTEAATGTGYTSQNTSIVQVLPDGNLQAVGEGETTVTATNSGKSAIIKVIVDFVDPDWGTRRGGAGTGYDLAITYSDPVTLTPAPSAPFSLFGSDAITLPANAKQMTFGFNNNSGLPQLGVPRGLATWKLGKGSDPNCSISFSDNIMPTDQPFYAVQRGQMTITLPPNGGKCVLLTNIEGMSDSQADKWTITNPSK